MANEHFLKEGEYQTIEHNLLSAIVLEQIGHLFPEEDNAPKMPDFPPGLIGDIAKDVLPRMTYVQPGIAMATALMAVSRLSDHQFVVVAPNGRETALNLYSLVTASTGVGKDTVATYLDKLGCAVGNASLVGGSMASPPAMGRVLGKRPANAHLIVMDEIGKKLEFAASGSGAHEAAVLATAMEIYGRAFNVYSGREYAQEKMSVNAVELPFLCIVGMSTPEALKKSLTTVAVFDGFLNRLEYFPQVGGLVRNEQQSFGPIPENIIERCRGMWPGPECSRWIDTRCVGQAERTDTAIKIRGYSFWPIHMTNEAHRLFDEFDRSNDVHRERGGAKGALLGRATERAIRMAGLLAINKDFDNGIELTAEHARWAINWVRFAVHHMLEFVGDGLTTANYADLVDDIEGFCRDAIADPGSVPINKTRPQWRVYLRRGFISRSHVTWKFKRSKKYDLDAAIETLIEAGILQTVEEQPVGGGTTTTLFRLG